MNGSPSHLRSVSAAAWSSMPAGQTPAPILDALPAAALPEVVAVPPDAAAALPEVLPFVPPRLLRNPLAWLVYILGTTANWLFGLVSLILGLAILAATPLAQFLALGYLIEAAGRIARTGRLRDGFIGIDIAARLGSIVLGTALVLAPLYVISALAVSAELIDPGGTKAARWQLALTVLTVVVVLHIIGAWSRGGRLHHFLWPSGNPVRLLRRLFRGEVVDVLGLLFLGNFWWLGRRLRQGGYYREARDAVWEFVTALRLPYYFWLGVRGFVGALIWMALPISLIALGRLGPLIHFQGQTAQGVALFLAVMLGWLLTSLVLLYVPFLQIHLAQQDRFRAMFEVGAVRAAYRRAPLAFTVAFFVTLALALPLYLLRVEQVPGDAAWMLSVFFVATILPTRLLTGWAYSRALRRSEPRSWFFRWTCRPLMLATAATYTFFVFFTQYIGGEGVFGLYLQHAFMLPVPFFVFD